MMETSKLCFLVGLLFTASNCSISDKCLKCICVVESNCKAIECKKDAGTYSCGYYQIKEPYYTDCGKPGKPGAGWKECALDYSCATKCVKNYMAKYCTKTSCPDTCESYARIHNGGPQGRTNPKTIPYWHKVQKEGC